MGIQEKRGTKNRSEKTLFFPFFQEVKSRDSGRDFFWTCGGEGREILTNSNR
jgi:hypothetical protein